MLVKPDSFEVILRLDDSDQGSSVIDHPIMLLAEKAGQLWKERDQGKEDEFYYFRDLMVLTDVEPCFMCAMALIHSRTKIVLFKNRNSFDGALVSCQAEMHCLK